LSLANTDPRFGPKAWSKQDRIVILDFAVADRDLSKNELPKITMRIRQYLALLGIVRFSQSMVPIKSPAQGKTSKMGTVSKPRKADGTMSRRTWIQQGAETTLASIFLLEIAALDKATADDGNFFEDPEIQEIYENPAIPRAPEEKSGLVVLRVAEVAHFQEKILRSIASGELQGVQVSPMQFLFGTQILLRNSNLDGNMKLMIDNEIPRKRRKEAVKNAVAAMNQLLEIAKFSESIQRDFETIEMVEMADMYRNVRVNLNQLYEYLPEREKDKYYGYFVAVTEYEKKIAGGTYNPDIDGTLKFDD